jgi:type VI secretion system protein
LSGCGAVLGNINTKDISITAAPGANRDTPVALDIVAVGDETMVQVLMGLDANGWFSQKEKFQHQSEFNVKTFEVVPGQTISGDVEYSWTDRRKYKAVFVFAKMQSPGLHNVRIDTFSNPVIVIRNNSLRVTEKQN